MAKILLVEDDKSLREIYGVRLLAEGYDIVSAGDGEEALAMAIKERPDLILSDVMMPKISGFDMLDILRSTTETRDIKVIIMTALSSEDQRQRGESLGADMYLVKSQVGIEDVVKAVRDVLAAPDRASIPAQSPPRQAQELQAAPTPVAQQATTAPAAQPPTPQAQPRPASVVPPARQTTPPIASNPVAPQPQQPAAPAPPQTPPVSPQTIPQPPQAPPPPKPTATSGELPKPTAPFSTPRPASLGERVIQPISQPKEDTLDVNKAIDEALNAPPQPSNAPTSPSVSPSAQPPQPNFSSTEEYNPYAEGQTAQQPQQPAAPPTQPQTPPTPAQTPPVAPPQA